jgi:hypothetical protein
MAERVRIFELPGVPKPAPLFSPKPGPPQPGSKLRESGRHGSECDGDRMLLVGAGLATTLLHPSVLPFERLWRRLPEQGLHSGVSPTRPFIIELGSFRVPKDRALLIYDFRPDVYRFSGIDPNDWVPVESGRFQQITYDVVVNGNHRPGNKEFEIQPIPRQFQSNEFINPLPTDPEQPFPQTLFNQARFNQFGSAAGAGMALLPQRAFRYGARNAPFTLFLNQNDTFTARAVFWRPVMSPLAFIEFDFAGFELPKNTALDILSCFNPIAAAPPE